MQIERLETPQSGILDNDPATSRGTRPAAAAAPYVGSATGRNMALRTTGAAGTPPRVVRY